MTLKKLRDLNFNVKSYKQAIEGIESAIEAFTAPNFFPENIITYTLKYGGAIEYTKEISLMESTLNGIVDFLEKEKANLATVLCEYEKKKEELEKKDDAPITVNKKKLKNFIERAFLISDPTSDRCFMPSNERKSEECGKCQKCSFNPMPSKMDLEDAENIIDEIVDWMEAEHDQ